MSGARRQAAPVYRAYVDGLMLALSCESAETVADDVLVDYAMRRTLGHTDTLELMGAE